MSNKLAPEFGELYSEHSRAIYYLALRFLGDPDKAEDATHDVFLKAFRKMDQFRGDSSFRTWLYRITINHCRNLQQTWSAQKPEAHWSAALQSAPSCRSGVAVTVAVDVDVAVLVDVPVAVAVEVAVAVCVAVAVELAVAV